LNRGDDVAHPSGPGSTEGGEQRARPPEGESALDETFVGRVAYFVLGQRQLAKGVSEVLVLDPGHLVTADRDVTTPRETK